MSSQSFRQAKNHSTTSTTQEQHRAPHQVDYGSNLANLDALQSNTALDVVGNELAWAGALLMDADQIGNNGLSDIIPTADANGALSVASAAVTGVKSFQESAAMTTAGKTLDAMLDASGSLMVGANPVVGLVDTLLPQDMKFSTLLDGGSTAMATMVEGLVTDESDGMEAFMENAKDGDYTWIMKEAVEAGEYWAGSH